MTHLKVVVDRDLCEVNGACVLVAPNVFEIGDDDTMRIRTPLPPDEEMARVRDALRRCPKGALALEKA